MLVLPATATAQQHTIDSLKAQIRNLSADSLRVNTLNQLTDKLWQTGLYDTAIAYSRKALVLAEKLDFKRGLATALINTSLIYWKQGDYAHALEYDFRALKISESTGNRQGAARALNSIGLIYFSQENYRGALEKYNASLAIRETLGDVQAVAGSLNNIGEVYKAQGNNAKALEYYQRALALNRKTGNRNWESININNIALVYREQAGNTPPAQRKKYFHLARGYYAQALSIRRQINDRQGIALSGLGLGILYTQHADFAQAQTCLDSALLVAKNIGYREGIKATYLALVQLDSTRGNWNGAFRNHIRYIQYRDSLVNEESTRKSVAAELNFAFEKKEDAARLEQEKKDVLAAEEKQQQQIIIIAVSAGLVLVLVLALVILKSLRRNQQQTKIITAQKETVERQKEMVDEKQREITDSINYAERIQRSFLASAQLLRRRLGDHFVLYAPRDIVSGDFYWAAELSNGNFLLATADSTGHGVPGAIMSMLNISCLEKAVEEQNLLEPAGILNYARAKIIERLKKDGSPEGGRDGMDCSLLSFAPGKKYFTYAAAHNPVWIVRQVNGAPELLALLPDKMPVGKHDKDQVPFAQHVVEVQPGDMVYALTDGIPDQFGGPGGKKFMYKGLKNFLLGIAHLPAADQKQKLYDAFIKWKGDLEQVDDVCIIGIRI